jgi:hypothetical protein
VERKTAYTIVTDVLEYAQRAIELAQEIGVNSSFSSVVSEIKFRYLTCDKSACIKYCDTKLPFDMVEVFIPTFELREYRKTILMEQTPIPIVLEFVGLLELMTLGLESADIDCSEDTIFFKVGSDE